VSETGILSRSFMEYDGSGNVIYANSFHIGAHFSVRMLQNGSIKGELRFHNGVHFQGDNYLRLLECPSGQVSFRVDGSTSSQGIEIAIEECSSMGHSEKHSEATQPRHQIECSFKAQKVSIGASRKQSKPEDGLIFQFGLLNLHKVSPNTKPAIRVNTDLGELAIIPYAGFEEMARLIHDYGVSLITSTADLYVIIDGRSNIGEYLKTTTEIVQKFLKITSLAHGNWNEWVFVSVYQHGTGSFICADLRSPITNASQGFPLTDTRRASIFIQEAWKGYSNTLTKHHGFDYALEWYVETSSSILEIKYLNAMTALELLMTYYYRHNETKFDRGSDFNQFYQKAKSQFDQTLDSSNIDKERVGRLKNFFSNMNQPDSPTKARKLIEHWGILTGDLEITQEKKRDIVDKIFDIRNEITHSGRYNGRGKDIHPLETLTKAYSALFSILTRIFLAMLKYTDSYRDMSRNGEFVELSKVCTSIRALVEQNKLSNS
jgi:hypothetical protein